MWRSLDVDAVVEALHEAGTVTVAGARGLSRPVTRARPAPTTEHLRDATSGELVVTNAATLLSTGEAPQQVVTRLDAAEVAGLAVRLDTDDHLPEGLLAAADQVALPILTFAAAASLAEVTTAVLDALLDAHRRRLEHVLDIHQQFARAVVAGGGAPELAATLHEVVGRPVAVVDEDGRPIAAAPADATIDLDPASATSVREPIRAGDHDYGAVVVDVGQADLDADGALAVERTAMGLAVRLAQARAVAEAEERFAAMSLEELVAGHAESADVISERAATLGWDLNRTRAVLLASIDPPEAGPIPPGALATIAAAARATLGRDAIVWTRSTSVAALIAPDTDAPVERRHIAERLRHELDDRLHSVNVSIGVGRCTPTPAELPRSFVEARRSVDVGRWATGRHATEVFDQLGLERLLASAPADDLAEFVEHAIGALVDHDRTHPTELVDTLAVWLETRNMAEAARRMHVHHNTLKNRLDRIEAILGPVVTDPARALECEVALYVARRDEGTGRSTGRERTSVVGRGAAGRR